MPKNGKQIVIMLDSGGGIQLQTARYCHSYDAHGRGEQCAHDIRDFFTNNGDTSDWEGNEPLYRREATQYDDTINRAELQAIIVAGEAIKRVGGGSAAGELIVALLGSQAVEFIATRAGYA